MDKIEGDAFSGIPSAALTLNLARSTIKMRHSAAWRVDKSNDVHDLVVCLTGSARYLLDGRSVTLQPGRAMLIPAGSRFVGQLEAGAERYTGIAQHFTLDLFGNVDLISQMALREVAPFVRWPILEPLVRHYREIAPPSSTTLMQHHLFMVILLEYLDGAFLHWRDRALGTMDGEDALSLHVMLAAARIAAAPLGETALDAALTAVPYNLDYFRRAFRDKIGRTPRKFLEFKRMEQAMNLLAAGHGVKTTAAIVGYDDVYYFSRMFRRYMGTSPSGYRLRPRGLGEAPEG